MTKSSLVHDRVATDLGAAGTVRGAVEIGWPSLDRHKVELRHETFSDAGPGGLIEAVVVLDECPGASHGYLVVFCLDRDSYGLATKGSAGRAGAIVGFYGSLPDTLQAM